MTTSLQSLHLLALAILIGHLIAAAVAAGAPQHGRIPDPYRNQLPPTVQVAPPAPPIPGWVPYWPAPVYGPTQQPIASAAHRILYPPLSTAIDATNRFCQMSMAPTFAFPYYPSPAAVPAAATATPFIPSDPFHPYSNRYPHVSHQQQRAHVLPARPEIYLSPPPPPPSQSYSSSSSLSFSSSSSSSPPSDLSTPPPEALIYYFPLENCWNHFFRDPHEPVLSKALSPNRDCACGEHGAGTATTTDSASSPSEPADSETQTVDKPKTDDLDRGSIASLSENDNEVDDAVDLDDVIATEDDAVGIRMSDENQETAAEVGDDHKDDVAIGDDDESDQKALLQKDDGVSEADPVAQYVHETVSEPDSTVIALSRADLIDNGYVIDSTASAIAEDNPVHDESLVDLDNAPADTLDESHPAADADVDQCDDEQSAPVQLATATSGSAADISGDNDEYDDLEEAVIATHQIGRPSLKSSSSSSPNKKKKSKAKKTRKGRSKTSSSRSASAAASLAPSEAPSVSSPDTKANRSTANADRIFELFMIPISELLEVFASHASLFVPLNAFVQNSNVMELGRPLMKLINARLMTVPMSLASNAADSNQPMLAPEQHTLLVEDVGLYAQLVLMRRMQILLRADGTDEIADLLVALEQNIAPVMTMLLRFVKHRPAITAAFGSTKAQDVADLLHEFYQAVTRQERFFLEHVKARVAVFQNAANPPTPVAAALSSSSSSSSRSRSISSELAESLEVAVTEVSFLIVSLAVDLHRLLLADVPVAAAGDDGESLDLPELFVHVSLDACRLMLIRHIIEEVQPPLEAAGLLHDVLDAVRARLDDVRADPLAYVGYTRLVSLQECPRLQPSLCDDLVLDAADRRLMESLDEVAASFRIGPIPDADPTALDLLLSGGKARLRPLTQVKVALARLARIVDADFDRICVSIQSFAAVFVQRLCKLVEEEFAARPVLDDRMIAVGIAVGRHVAEIVFRFQRKFVAVVDALLGRRQQDLLACVIGTLHEAGLSQDSAYEMKLKLGLMQNRSLLIEALKLNLSKVQGMKSAMGDLILPALLRSLPFRLGCDIYWALCSLPFDSLK